MRLPKIAWYAALALLGSQIMAAPTAPADEAALRNVVTAYEQAIRTGDVSKSGIRKTLATAFSAVLPSGQLITHPWNQAEPDGPGWIWVVMSGVLGGLAGAVIGFAAARALGRRNAPASGRVPSTSEQPGAPAASRARAWDKSTSHIPPTADAESAPAQGRSWHEPTTPEAAAPEPSAPESGTDAPDSAPPAARSGKKRAWEN